ncbi:BQ5605_C044g12161 [Microbotryum silenes-dioicae]|uniref:BQ5605_C044g12161 protein n=1 Tax=Microbotryum silenes-dioicae TaxID=796604 RepID=A0A2X0MT62_9BASI|nr:BQ5605_C044g12161 [Microbotryum silenes-dioicae]
MTKTNRRTKTATMRMKTARKGTKRMVMANDEGQVKGSRWRVSRSQFFAHYLPNATSTSQSRIAPSVPSWKNLRLTTTQGINGLTPNQIGRSMTLGSTFKNRPRDITWQRYQDAMACVVKHGKPPLLITMTYGPEAPEIKAALGPNDKACNRPDLIARVFEAKSGNKRHAGCFGDECRMNGFDDDFDRLSPLTNMTIAELLAFGLSKDKPTQDVFLATDALIRISTFGRRVDKQYGALLVAHRSRHFGSLDGVVTTATPLEIGSLICFDLKRGMQLRSNCL